MELIIIKFSILIIFINLLINLIKIIFKLNSSYNKLYCGISGFSLKQNGNKRTAIEKLKILGLYNIARGKDASGVFLDNKITKQTVTFDNFIQENILKASKTNNVALVHTRQGSIGYKKTIEEAHPFLINENMVFTHNGTISNIKELCEKYGDNFSNYNVDSKALGTLLYTEGTKVLKNYVGAAALAYTFLDEPNSLYLFHGSSKDFKNGVELEERPLFILETKDGIFYSSLKNSLEAIKEENDKIYNLAYNTVYKISNGEFILEESIFVDRSESNVKTYSPPAVKTTMFTVTSNRKEHNVLTETLPSKVIEGNDSNFIYYHFGRHWLFPRTILNGQYHIDKKGYISSSYNEKTELYSFVDGVMLKDNMKYHYLKDLKSTLTSIDNYIIILSEYSRFPITDIPTKYTSFDVSNISKAKTWFFNKKLSSENFTPKFSGRNYKLSNGILTDLSTSNRKEKVFEELAYTVFKSLEEKSKEEKLKEGIQGGNSDYSPFLNKTKEDEKFFWEIPFSSKKEAYSIIGDKEENALREYYKNDFITQFSIEATDSDLENTIDILINDCIKDSSSIQEVFLGEYGYVDVEDKLELLNKIYHKDTFIEFLEQKEDDIDDMEISNIVNSVQGLLNIYEDLYMAAKEITDGLDDYSEKNKAIMSEISESIVFSTDISIDELKDKIVKVAYNKELVDNIDKIIERKKEIYGII
jgi:hypothetical protein